MACGVRQELKRGRSCGLGRLPKLGLNGLWGPSGIETNY